MAEFFDMAGAVLFVIVFIFPSLIEAMDRAGTTKWKRLRREHPEQFDANDHFIGEHNER